MPSSSACSAGRLVARYAVGYSTRTVSLRVLEGCFLDLGRSAANWSEPGSTDPGLRLFL